MILLLALILSVDAKNEGCRVGCIYEGYDSGSYKDEKCLCVTEINYDDLISKKFKTLPKKANKRDDYEF